MPYMAKVMATESALGCLNSVQPRNFQYWNLPLSLRPRCHSDLKNALIRIENKSYGVCRVTGKLINKERLKLVPHATLSIEAKNLQK